MTTEDGADRLAFLRGLKARGLRGVELFSSDAHSGLNLFALSGEASWARLHRSGRANYSGSATCAALRCPRTSCVLLTTVPRDFQTFVATLVRSIFTQPDAESVRA